MVTAITGIAVIAASWNLMADTIRNWSERQKVLQKTWRAAVKSASEYLGVSEQSINKTLRTGKHHLLKSVEDALEGVLNLKMVQIKD